MIGITKEDLEALVYTDDYGNDLINTDEAIAACKELNPWQPIETAPKNREFLALSCERDHIELLINDEVEGKFFNQNSGNYTKKTYWSHWMEKPRLPCIQGVK